MSVKIALLGAESTGKSTLALALCAALQAKGQSAVCVSEYLREWCEQMRRTPQKHEQAQIAKEQQNRLDAAAQDAQVVIADTTPLMIAVYSDFIFSDRSLYASALQYQRSFDVTLLTALDLAWVADGLQREGVHVQMPVDALLRQALHSAKIDFSVVFGQAEQRLANALNAINSRAVPAVSTGKITHNSIEKEADLARWRCEKCSDADCEHRLFRRLLKSSQAFKLE